MKRLLEIQKCLGPYGLPNDGGTMEKMMSGFDRGRELTDGADGRERLVSSIEMMISGAKPTDMFGGPEV